MHKKKIDQSTYARSAHFDYFCSLQNPHLGVTVDVDVTDLVSFCKEHHCSFYLTFLHAAALAANRIPEFRRRIEGGEIVEYDVCATSHTESTGDGTYGYCTLYHDRPFEEYILYARKEQEQCRKALSIEEDSDPESLYFISTLPWITYRSLIQPTDGVKDSNPRITWGKYAEDFRGKLMMPVSVLVHHALVDGIHLGAFYANLAEELALLTAR